MVFHGVAFQHSRAGFVHHISPNLWHMFRLLGNGVISVNIFAPTNSVLLRSNFINLFRMSQD